MNWTQSLLERAGLSGARPDKSGRRDNLPAAPHLNDVSRREHKRRNRQHSIILIVGLGSLMLISAYLLFSVIGLIWVAILTGLLMALAPRVPPEVVMRIYRARPVDARHGSQVYRLVEVLSDRAELPSMPELYVVPSMTLNAFATGRPEKAAIAVTEGLMRKLKLSELAGVLAHEMSHIRNNDLATMALADTLSRITQFMSYGAIVLLIVYMPAILTDSARVPWLAIIVLYLAPTIGSLLQLGLSRAREYDADLEGALLTGDPMGLASALEKLEHYQGHAWEDLVLPGRRIPQPSLLRSHPQTKDRVARLRALQGQPDLLPIDIPEGPMMTLIGLGPIAMRPRYRFPGVWF